MDNRSRTRREIDLLDPTEVSTILEACGRRSPSSVRNRALIATLFGAGLRISEVLALRPKDLDLERLAVTVQRGKGGKRRVAALFPDAAEIVRRWADRRTTLGLSGRHPFFATISRGTVQGRPTAPGRPLTREYVAVMLRRLAARAGIEKRVHPHGFRHAHADLLRRRGWDVEEIRRQLGHSSLRVTGQYLDHLGAHELPERMREIGVVLG